MKSPTPPQIAQKLWLASLVYLLFLAFGFSTFWNDANLPDWTELFLKITGWSAFTLLAVLPIIYLATHVRTKKTSKALTIAGWMMLAGYTWLLGWLILVKIRTCKTNEIPWDNSWHCNVEGKHVVAYFVAIPIIATLCGLVIWGIVELIPKFRHRR